jgi:enamine deaminase RidA (YjgF/YER057c/UK114 family)
MSSQRQNFSSGNIWENRAGFSRVVRVGNFVQTAGTVAVNENGIAQGDGCFEQCAWITKLLEGIMLQAGARLADVVKVTAYLKDINDADEFTRFHHEYFANTGPAATCVVVRDLFGVGTVVELEFLAIVSE